MSLKNTMAGLGIKKQISESTMVLTPVMKSKNEKKVSDDTIDRSVLCGFGRCTPSWLQSCASPKLFLAIYSLCGIVHGGSLTYFVGCMSTMEKRFSFDSKISGLIMVIDEIAPILLGAFIGYFGGMAHRPRLLALGMCLGSLSNFIMASPHFIYGSKITGSVNEPSLVSPRRPQPLCEKTDYGEKCDPLMTSSAIWLFCFANLFKGISNVVFYTIGTSYLDDNIKKKNTPFYIGTLFALRLLGPVLGFLLSSFCLQYYEDPFHDPGFDQKDPRWIGAWWLGFVILGVSILVFSLPMILFPRRFPTKKLPPSLSKKKDMQNEKPESPLQQLKGMGKAMKRLGKNPILIFHYLGGVFRLNGIVGYYVLLPKYMEMQFRQSASKASLYSGPASIVGMQIGILLGGYIIRRFRPRPRVMTGGIMIAESFSVIALICCMLITCPAYNLSGTSVAEDGFRLNLQNECNANCSCTTKVYSPVCGPDGVSTYFSPCFAGCSDRNETSDGKEIFTNCQCVHDDKGEFSMGSVLKNYCDSDCQWMVTFIVVLSLGKLLSSTARVGNTLVTLRCVDPEDKSVALGALSGVFSLFAFIPYPLIYGALTDASCLVWEKSCGKTGNCWIYDADKFRYLLHGVSAAFVFLGCVTDSFVWFLSPRLRNLYDDDEDKEDTTEYDEKSNPKVLPVALSNGDDYAMSPKTCTTESDGDPIPNGVTKNERTTSM